MKKMNKSFINEKGFDKYIDNEQEIMRTTCVGNPFLVGLEFAFETEENRYIGMKFSKGCDF